MPRRNGRQPKRKQVRIWTDEQIIAALVEKKGAIELAAEFIGCSPTTIHTRKKESEAVAECLRNQTERVNDVAELIAFQTMLSEDKRLAFEAARFRLITKGKHRGYTEKTEVEHSGSIGGGLEDMTNEELEAEALRLEGLRAAAANPGSAAGSA